MESYLVASRAKGLNLIDYNREDCMKTRESNLELLNHLSISLKAKENRVNFCRPDYLIIIKKREKTVGYTKMMVW